MPPRRRRLAQSRRREAHGSNGGDVSCGDSLQAGHEILFVPFPLVGILVDRFAVAQGVDELALGIGRPSRPRPPCSTITFPSQAAISRAEAMTYAAEPFMAEFGGTTTWMPGAARKLPLGRESSSSPLPNLTS